MKKLLVLVAFSLIASTAFAKPSWWPSFPGISSGVKEEIVTSIKAKTTLAELTIISYEGGDNNLDSDLTKDVAEMAKAGNPAGTEIVVAYDGVKKSWRGVVEKNKITKEKLASFNSADPKNLQAAIEWAAKIRPAKKYMLIMSDHGIGWINALPPVATKTKSIIDDETSGNEMSIAQVRQVLANVKAKGINFGVVSFDACLMAMIEVAYELADYADVIVASEETEPGSGWPYDSIYSSMTNLDSKAIGQLIVNKYITSYLGKTDATMSAIDAKKLKAFVDDVFTKFVAKNSAMTRADYMKAYDQAQKYQPENLDTYVDLNSFLSGFANEDAKKVMGWVSSTIIATKSTGSGVKGSTGMSIYAPKRQYKKEYAELLFNKQTGWNNVVGKVIGGRSK